MDKNLSELQKALLLSAVFLIDFMYFEDNAPTERRNRRNGGGENRKQGVQALGP